MEKQKLLVTMDERRLIQKEMWIEFGTKIKYRGLEERVFFYVYCPGVTRVVIREYISCCNGMVPTFSMFLEEVPFELRSNPQFLM